MKNNIVIDFKDKEELYDSFRERIVNLLKDLISNSNIIIHQIESRTKSFDSLSKKVQKKDKYENLSEITDIVGIRIITYLESEVDSIDKLIRKEFEIDSKNSIDKRILQTNEFGYRSLHIVATIEKNRLKLTEYRRYKGLKFEIQIRSILQHAWAEIEHDLGYKGKTAIPKSSIRTFNRMAALLESADIEFDRLKKELTKYENEVPELIKKTPEDVNLNQASLNSLNQTNQTFEKIREYVRKECEAEFTIPPDYTDYLDKFEFFEIKTIKELQELISENSEHYISFVKQFITKGISKTLSFSLPIYWFQHFLAAKSKNETYIKQYQNYGNMSISGTPKRYIKDYENSKKL